MSHWKITLNSEIYMEWASETDVNGIPCSCLERCKTATRYMLIEASVPVMLKILSLDG